MGSLWIPAVLLVVFFAVGLEIPPPGLKPLAYLSIHGLILISLAIQAMNLVFLFEARIHLTTQNRGLRRASQSDSGKAASALPRMTYQFKLLLI